MFSQKKGYTIVDICLMEATTITVKAVKALQQAGKEILEKGVAPFKTDNNTIALEDRAKTLASSKDGSEAELSYVLYALRETRGYLDKHYTRFVDYAEAELGIGATKANALAASWEMFVKLGLSTTALGGDNRISWSKFRLLRPAVEKGIITQDNILEWLPRVSVAKNGLAMRDSDLITQIKRLVEVDSVDEATATERLITLKMKIPGERVEELHTYEDVIRQGMQIDDRGMQHLKAMEMLSNGIVAGNVEAAKLYGLSGLKRAAEAMYPGIVCTFLATEGVKAAYKDIDVLPVSSVYQAYVEIDGKRQLVHALAHNDEAAEAMLGTKEFRKFSIYVPGVTEPEKKPEPEPSSGDVVALSIGIGDPDLAPISVLAAAVKAMTTTLIEKKVLSKDGCSQKLTALKAEIDDERRWLIAATKWLIDTCKENQIVLK